jgi:hypothetical protein
VQNFKTLSPCNGFNSSTSYYLNHYFSLLLVQNITSKQSLRIIWCQGTQWAIQVTSAHESQIDRKWSPFCFTSLPFVLHAFEGNTQHGTSPVVTQSWLASQSSSSEQGWQWPCRLHGLQRPYHAAARLTVLASHSFLHSLATTYARPTRESALQRQSCSKQANRKRVNAITPLLPMFRQTDISLRVHDATALPSLYTCYLSPACLYCTKPKSLFKTYNIQLASL